MLTQKYKKWIDWIKQNKPIKPMTNSQWKFAEKVLNDTELEQMLAAPGDLETIFESVRHYLKNKPEPETKNK